MPMNKPSIPQRPHVAYLSRRIEDYLIVLPTCRIGVRLNNGFIVTHATRDAAVYFILDMCASGYRFDDPVH